MLDEYVKYPFLKSTEINRKYRKQTIENIGKLFNCSYNDIHSKMRAMRLRQRRVELYIQARLEAGEDTDLVRLRWPFYDKLKEILNPNTEPEGLNLCRKWTKEETFELLAEIVKYPVLMPYYEYTVPRQLRRKITDQIGTQFDTTGKEVEIKFKKLRDFYGGRIRAIKKKIEQGCDPNESLVTWPFYDIMKSIERKEVDEMPGIETESEKPEEVLVVIEEDQEEIHQEPTQQSLFSPDMIEHLDKAIGILNQVDDEYGPFVRFITIQMHKLTSNQVQLFEDLCLKDILDVHSEFEENELIDAE